jgi:two-component system response regulator YesN
MQIDRYTSWDEAIEYIYQLSGEIFKHQCEEEKTRVDNTVLHIHEFIAEHLSENLSLVRLAEQVYLNPCYLSRLYKQATGMNLSNYIDIVRIEKAKELLNHKNMKIYEVADAVGYETPASFTRFFRKITGLSPHEYLDSVKSIDRER